MPGFVQSATPTSVDQPSGARLAPNARIGSTIDFELTSAIRRIFLTPASGVRSVLFCTVPGEEIGTLAKDAAQTLSAQSGQRVAFVEYTSRELAQERTYTPDLLTSFAFVIVTATASSAADLISIAAEVDGVIVVITKNQTRVDTAHALVTTLRKSRANLLGTILETNPFRHS